MRRRTTTLPPLIWLSLLLLQQSDADNYIHQHPYVAERYRRPYPSLDVTQQQEDISSSSRRQQQGRISPPAPPNVLPLRFLRAEKNDPTVGLQRYEETLRWRKQNNIDALLLYESYPDFQLMKQYYPHYYHYTGYNNEPCFYEFPAKTNFVALRQRGVTIPIVLRHYYMILEFQWQYIQRNDLMRSIYIIDLDGITMRKFFSETMDFLKQAMTVSSRHYPERAGHIYILNVPSYFQIIWTTIRPLIDPSTLDRVHIVRKEDILSNLLKHIPLEHIPPQYGGTSVPLGYSPQEQLLLQFVEHRNHLLLVQNRTICPNCNPNIHPNNWPCPLCRFTPARSY